LAFYEQAFNAKVEDKDTSQNGDCYKVPESNKNLVMHAQFKLDDEVIMLCDMPPETPAKVGDNIAIMTEFANATAATAIFDALKADGEVHMEMSETFWNISTGCPD
jgi:PhnB protein